MRSIDDYLVILIPSRDGRAFVDTSFNLAIVARLLGKEPLAVCSDGFTYWDARNKCIMKFLKALRTYGIDRKGRQSIRAVWVDNDILIDEPVEKVAETIARANAGGYNVIANYKTTWGPGQIVNTIMLPNADGKTYTNATDEQLAEGKLPKGIVGGLGFYYGLVPLGYEYCTYPPYETEDICFFRDLPINPVYVPLKLGHNKSVIL